MLDREVKKNTALLAMLGDDPKKEKKTVRIGKFCIFAPIFRKGNCSDR